MGDPMTNDGFWHEKRERDGYVTHIRLTVAGRFYAHEDRETGTVELVTPSGWSVQHRSLDWARQDIEARGF